MSGMDEWIVRGTALAAFVCHAVALGGHRRAWWRAGTLLLIVHVVCAFQFAHHWSHAAALTATARQTAEVTGWSSGMGLWFNYAFIALCLNGWQGSAVWLRGLVAFMWFNATVAFGHAPVSWICLGVWIVLAICFFRRPFPGSTSPPNA